MCEFHSSRDVHGHFSLIVMCGVGSCRPVAELSMLVAVALHSSCDVQQRAGGRHPSFGDVLPPSCA